jgi:hypothetical protein
LEKGLGGRKIREKGGLRKGIFGLGDILVYGREENWERQKEEGR